MLNNSNEFSDDIFRTPMEKEYKESKGMGFYNEKLTDFDLMKLYVKKESDEIVGMMNSFLSHIRECPRVIPNFLNIRDFKLDKFIENEYNLFLPESILFKIKKQFVLVMKELVESHGLYCTVYNMNMHRGLAISLSKSKAMRAKTKNFFKGTGEINEDLGVDLSDFTLEQLKELFEIIDSRIEWPNKEK